METLRVCLEVGKKKTFASALDWPGWCRSQCDEEAAVPALAAYAPRYRNLLSAAGLGFFPEKALPAWEMVARLPGDAGTDFGAPMVICPVEFDPLSEAELARQQAALMAGWAALRQALTEHAGHPLRKGPRGGGRSVEQIGQHTLEAQRAYLSTLGWKPSALASANLDAAYAATGEEMIQALAAAQRGELPATGPRGGQRWPARYFIRRAAWHAVDHLWEIEDRLE